MSRFFVPSILLALVGGLALGLIGGVVARSPETHANVRPAGFDRTAIGHIGEVLPYEGIGVRDAGAADIADPIARGRILFLARGCAACHGIGAQGGVVAPALDLEELWKEDFLPIVRSGPGGMPAFTDSTLSDADLDSIYSFLKAAEQVGPGS